mgnify:CR=1 FL=1
MIKLGKLDTKTLTVKQGMFNKKLKTKTYQSKTR